MGPQKPAIDPLLQFVRVFTHREILVAVELESKKLRLAHPYCSISKYTPIGVAAMLLRLHQLFLHRKLSPVRQR